MCAATAKALKLVAGGMGKRDAARKAGIAESTLHRAIKRGEGRKNAI
jgi:transposase-like protein